MREPVLSIGESAPAGAAPRIPPHARVVSTNEYDADRGCRAEDFQVVTSEFAKRFVVIGEAALTAVSEDDDTQHVTVPGYGSFVPADVAGTIMEPVVSRRGVERWRPRTIRNAAELRAYNESEFGQHKRAMESSGNPFDDDVGVGASPSPTALIDQHEFIPFLNGPFYKQLYIYDYLLMHARCLVGETRVPLLDGTSATIREIADRCRTNEALWVYSCDDRGVVVPGRVLGATCTGVDEPVVSVMLDNGESITCTGDHRFLLRDGSYREAAQLRPGDSLMPLYRKRSEETKRKISRGNRAAWADFPTEKWEERLADLSRARAARRLNHKVVSVSVQGRADVYDLMVEKYHNFGVEQGVFVHNSFQLVNHNALAASAVKMLTRFTLGRGVSFHIKHDQARSVWQEFWDRNNMRRRIQQAARDLTWQGELLFRFYEQDGFVSLRVLDASVCWEIVTDPEDIDHVYYFHLQWPAPYQLYTTGQIPVTRYIIQQVPPTNIQHVKINCSSMEKRGRSDLMPGMSWLKRIDDYYNGETLKRVLGANLVWTITVKGDQADVDAFLSNPNLTQLPPAGGVWIQNESVTLEPQIGAMTEGRGGTQIGSELSSLFATSVNLPAEYFNISGERGGARATALVRTDPAVKTIESRQQLLQEEIEEIYLRVMEAAYNAGRLSLQDATEEPERQDAGGAFDDVGGEHDKRVLRTIGKPRARLVPPVRAQSASAAQRAQIVSRSTVHRSGTTPPPVRAHAAGQPSTPVIRAHAAGQPSEPVTRAHAAGTPSHALATSEIVGNGDGAVRAEIVSHARRIRVPRTPVH